MKTSNPQTAPKKRSRRFYIILITTASLLTVTVGVFCVDHGNRPNYGPGPIEIEVSTDKPFYLQGEEVNFIIYVNNPQNWPVAYPDLVGYDVEKDGISIDSCDVNVNFGYEIPTIPAHSRTAYRPFVNLEPKNLP